MDGLRNCAFYYFKITIFRDRH